MMKKTSYKNDFPMYANHPDLAYLDSAATALTPQVVLDKMQEYYTHYNANVSRGVYNLSETATREYEDVRQKTARFIGASRPEEIIFTSGTTQSINLVARGLAENHNWQKEAHIVVTAMDHHANFVPWQRITSNFDVVGIADDYTLDIDDLKATLTPNTKVLAFPLISNVLGTINLAKEIAAIARKMSPEILIIIDAAQAAPHQEINVKELDCDFLALSAHKMYGPTGTGILWGRYEQLDKLSPMVTGGEMISLVSEHKTTFRELPHRLEAGTPNIAGVIGLGAAIDYISDISFEAITLHEKDLTHYAQAELAKIPDLTIYGPTDLSKRIGVISFTLDGIHPHDIASVLDTEVGASVRAGNHCAMPLHTEHLQIPATARASFGIYNQKEDIDKLITGLQKAKTLFTPTSN